MTTRIFIQKQSPLFLLLLAFVLSICGANNASAQLCRGMNLVFADRLASPSTALNNSIDPAATALSRTVTVTFGSGVTAESISVQVTNSMTLDGFISAFNKGSISGRAAYVNYGTTKSPSYGVVISMNRLRTGRRQIGVAVGQAVRASGKGALSSWSVECCG